MKLKKYLGLFLMVAVSFIACEKIEILPPPDNLGYDEKTGTGNSDARSMLFVMNDISSRFIDPQSALSNISTDSILLYFTNDEFARPLDLSKPNDLALQKLPLLKSNNLMALQEPIGNLAQSMYPGAFGESGNADWHLNSNWWVLDPQHVDYAYDINSVEIVEGSITSNTTWNKNTRYLLRGQVFVKSGVTLTIEPGTVIFGEKGVGLNSGVLCFNRGSKIDANGTPEEPIVFTGTMAPGERTRGQWGGIMFCGNAPNGKGEHVLIEGIQGDEEDGRYGGNIPDDNSGSFSYWRVEFAGIAVSAGNELNSLTFGSVGSQTSAHHIIVSFAGDDSFEWFGGTMDLSYLAVYNCLDDDLDMDSGYSGSIQYGYLVRNPFAADESGSASFEVSSSKSLGNMPQTSASISNFTVVGPLYQLHGTGLNMDPKYQGGIFSKEDAQVKIINSVFIGCPVGVQNP